MARQLGAALLGFDRLDAPLGSLSLIDAEERARHLAAESCARPDLDTQHSISAAFRAVVAAQPDQVAVRAGERTLTYRELLSRANRLARHLATEMNVAPGDVVGVVVDRSPEVIVALLAVLEVGAVYLPLDAEYPPERLRFLVEDARVRALLLDSRHLPALESFYATPMFALDLQLPALAGDDSPLGRAPAPGAPAYIIYTSGSTGKPKGVLLGQRGFVNMIRHHAEAFGVTPADRLAQFYALTFDSSLFEVFMALLSGARLVLVERGTIDDPRAFSRLLVDEGVTFVTLPPVYLATLEHEALRGLRVVVSAGDNARPADALRFAQKLDYYNSYGPTETTVCASHHKVDPGRAYGTRIPIGRPVSNTWIYLVDERLEPVPDGLPGEIAVSGLGLALGYLGREELTRERFVPSPFVPGERLYLTGDLGLRLPDGELELIGRADTQVKVRGYRIELGEVEANLRLHPQVHEVAVLAREDEPGDRRLVAYLTTRAPLEAAELRAHLGARLPAYMLPSAYVFLEHMPVTANGKIDRRALPAPRTVGGGLEAQGAPRTPAEETLCRVWGEVLGVPRVGVHDNFFELGGDSILLIQVAWRAGQAGLHVLPKQIFDRPTVAGLAEVATPAAAPAAAREALTGELPLTPSQHWFLDRPREAPEHYNQTVLLEVPAGVDPEKLRACAERLAEQHDALRLRFTREGDGWRQTCADPGGPAPFETADFGDLPAERRESAFEARLAQWQAGFDLARGPLWRLVLARFGPGAPARLVLSVHHLAVDGVSWGILLGDLQTLYAQLERGAVAELPPRTTSLRDWNRRLARYADEIADEHAFWLAAPEGARPLPRDLGGSEDDNRVGTAATCRATLSAELTRTLLHEVPRASRAQIGDLLLTALALAVAEWSGRRHLHVALEGHGREDLFPECDVSRTVGWFTSVYPLWLELDAGSAPGPALRAVKEHLRRVPRQGLGYGVLRYLGRDAELRARLAASPQPEILFNYLGQSDRILGERSDWRPLLEGEAHERSPRARREHLFEVEAVVAGGRLRLGWTYSRAHHAAATVERLCARQAHFLEALAGLGAQAGEETLTPADFPAAGLSQDDLDLLLRRLRS